MPVRLTCLFAVLAVGPLAAADPPAHRAAGDGVIRARSVLVTYCGECHGENPAGRMRAYDHKETVTAAGKPVPFAGKSRSLILDFIEDGSMPPGHRPRPTADEVTVLKAWVEAGAPEYPPKYNDEYAAKAVVADLKRVPAEDRQYTRYVSFAHLLADPSKPTDLAGELKRAAAAEVELTAAVGPLAPVDPSATVFRFDIRKPGWHHTGLFQQDLANGDFLTDPMTPFDLIWLENPHVVKAGSVIDPAVRAAVDEMNPHHPKADPTDLAARPVPNPFRPQPFLRGDWLAAMLRTGDTPTPLADDLAALAKLALWKEGEKPKGPEPRPFSQTPPPGTPPPPLSAWVTRGVPAAGAVTLTVDAQPAGPKHPQFTSATLTATANPDAFAQLLYVSPDGMVKRQSLTAGDTLTARRPTKLAANTDGTFSLSAIGVMHYVSFAAADAAPALTIVRSVHGSRNRPIYRVFPTDPAAKLTRAVVTFEVVAK